MLNCERVEKGEKGENREEWGTEWKDELTIKKKKSQEVCDTWLYNDWVSGKRKK